jgi:AAA15 family ATPase/GTPase
VSSRKIIEEWLFEITKSTEKLIYQRITNEDESSLVDIKLKLKKDDKNRLDLIGKNLPPHLLFLGQVDSNFIRDIEPASPIFEVYDWFTKKLTIIKPNQKFGEIDFIGEDTDLSKAFCEFLKIFNLGIEGIESVNLDFEKTLAHFPDKLKESFTKDLEPNKKTIISINDERYSILKKESGEMIIVRLKTKHKVKNSKQFEFFETNEESDGTQRVFDFIPALANLANEDVVYIIDEIDRSLHPILTKGILELFLKNSQGLSSQLIFTTHESSLLDLKLVRKDAIWFVEKNEFSESDLYCLDEFKPRPDKLINKDYLLGRYGAIPFLGDIENLGWLKN